MKHKQARQTGNVSFSDAFDVTLKLLLEKQTLFDNNDCGAQSRSDHKSLLRMSGSDTSSTSANIRRREKLIRQFEAKLTPGWKLAEISRNRLIVPLSLLYIRKCQPSFPLNVQALINWLKSQGALSIKQAGGRSHDITDRTVRLILERKLGIKGRPGRKPPKNIVDSVG